jgi:hypothetical protein
MKKILCLLLVVLVGCTSSENEAWEGQWQAKWTTDPAGYGELAKDLKFEMDGSFNFKDEKLTISAYGYSGCIFGTDTLEHTILWKINGDTLELQNTEDEPGIQYKILNQTDNEISLQLVEDIFITLSK